MSNSEDIGSDALSEALRALYPAIKVIVDVSNWALRDAFDWGFQHRKLFPHTTGVHEAVINRHGVIQFYPVEASHPKLQDLDAALKVTREEPDPHLAAWIEQIEWPLIVTLKTMHEALKRYYPEPGLEVTYAKRSTFAEIPLATFKGDKS